MENKLFISHASNDAPLARLLQKFIQDSMQVSNERIFCSSISGEIPAGKLFDTNINENMQQSSCVICLITRSYLNSMYCLMELGGAWFGNKTVIPIFVPPTLPEDLTNIPCGKIQSLFLTADGISSLYKRLNTLNFVHNQDIFSFPVRVKKFLEQIPYVHVTVQDDDRYYRAYVEKVGFKKGYTFFKIDRPLHPDSYNEHSFFAKTEQHWLMVKSMLLHNNPNFDSVRENDYIRFVISNSNPVSQFFESVSLNEEILNNVRDIYVQQIKLA